MSNKVSTSEKEKFYARFVPILIICWVIIFFAVKNCALKNFLEKNLTIK